MSSTGQGLSLRIKSIAGIIIFAGGLLGLGLTSEEIAQIADGIGDIFDIFKAFVGSLGTVTSIVTLIIGIIRNSRNKKLGLGRYSQQPQ